MNNNRRQRINTLKALVKRLRADYRNDPNITGIGWGLAKRSGELVPELSVIFHVREKYASNQEIEAAGSQPVPREIEGFATDVKQQIQSTPQWAGSRNDEMADPLVGGVASANLEQINRTFFWSGVGTGTLGILCRDADGNAMALSNWHVWADAGAKIGDRIIQPSTPEGGTYAESITKVGACGPLLSTVIEGRTPSPLSAGLYAGAAALTILAAATDHKDPIRRGQELTPVNPGTFTSAELLQLQFAFPEMIPWVGQPFPVDVHWTYARQTNAGEQIIEIQESRVNPQILLGQAVAPDRAHYQPGDMITLQAAIWDYQNRPADAYHVTAHLIPVNQPEYVLRTILHPSLCRPIDLAPRYRTQRLQEANPVTREDDLTCVSFGHYSPTTSFQAVENFGPLSVFQQADEPLQIVRWSDNLGSALLIPAAGLSVQHAPASGIRLRVAQLTNQPVVVRAFNHFGRQIGEVTAPNVQGEVHELMILARLISRIEISGSGSEGLLLSYCFALEIDDLTSTFISPDLLQSYLDIEVPFISRPDGGQVNVRRHCFRGRRQLPLDAPAGRYKIYLTVSNVNHVPPGTPPTEAARIIGGQELGTHSQALLCTFMLLADHVFDIF